MPLVPVSSPPPLLLSLAVAALGAVSLHVAVGDHQVLVEGSAPPLQVEVEHLAHVAQPPVEHVHLLEADLGLRAHCLRVLRQRLMARAHITPLLPHLRLPDAPPVQCFPELELLAQEWLLLALHVQRHRHLSEPLVHPGHLVATAKHHEQELRQLCASIFILQARSLRGAWVAALSLRAPERRNHPLSVGKRHIFERPLPPSRLAFEV